MQVIFHKRFAKQLNGHSVKTKRAFQKRLDIFLVDSFDEILSNHPLTGQWRGHRSIDITGDLRAVYREIDKDIVIFVAFGKHSQLYG